MLILGGGEDETILAGVQVWSQESECQTLPVVNNLLPKVEGYSPWCLPSCIFCWPSRDQNRQRKLRNSGRFLPASPTSACPGPLKMSYKTWVSPAHIQLLLLLVTPQQLLRSVSYARFLSDRTNVHYKIPLSLYCFPLPATDCKAIWKWRLISYRKALDGSVEMVVACFDIL